MTRSSVDPSCAAKLAAQFIDAYKQMAKKAHYRPAAPSDGMGHITVPLAELDLDQEAQEWAGWWAGGREEEMYQVIGCPDFHERAAFAVVIEAAGCLCGVRYRPAARLLRLAADMLDKAQARRDAKGMPEW